MSLRYLLDTDWIVHHFRGQKEFTEMVKRAEQVGIAVSILSIAELYEGVFRSSEPERDENRLHRFISNKTILGLDEGTSRIFGQERARLRKEGIPIGDMDLLIAATCVHHDLTLLTANIAHYQRIRGLSVQTHL